MTRSCSWLAVAALLLLVPPGCRKKTDESGSEPGGPLESVHTGSQSYQESTYDPSSAGDERKQDRRGPQRPRTLGPERSGAHILIAYKGSAARKPGITRSKDEAKALAKKLTEQARKDPSGFAALAKKHSDGPTSTRGGHLGAWRKGRMVPEFDKAIDTLKVGEVTGPVETKFGFHVIKRTKLPPTFAGRHILIGYAGARRAKATRSKEEALALAKKVMAEARKSPDKFADLAKKHSEGPSGPRGGSLGKWRKGRMIPAFDQAIQRMKIGEISEPVETPFGFHVIKREDPAKI